MRYAALLICSVSIILVFASYASADPIHALGARFPQVSPDGNRVLFSYNGDLWTVPSGGGNATRLTDNTAFERNGVWSPDGRKIAFSSNRRGNYDVFVMSADGGVPTELTFHDAGDIVTGFSQSGKILFYSFREWRGYQIMEVPETGGMAVPLTLDDEDTSYSCYTPSGDVIYSRGTTEWYRKGYHGSGNFELWFLDRKTLKSSRITDYEGNDYFPATADGKTIYFASERNGMYNVYRTSVRGGEPVRVTNVSEDGVTSPSISADGGTLVYENNGRLYRQSASGGSPSEIDIKVASDEKENTLIKSVFDTTDEFKVSPNGKYVAFTVRGDVYVVYTEDAFKPGEKPDRLLDIARRVTNNPARESEIWWHPKSDKLFYTSDRDGEMDIYVADLRTMAETRLTDSEEDDSWPIASHDGKKIAYLRGVNEIVVLDIDTHEATVVDRGEVAWGPYGGVYQFSPDDKWLAYIKFVSGFQSDIFVAKTDGSTGPENITRNPDWVSDLTWLPTGKGIVFSSDRDESQMVYVLDFDWKPKKFTEGFILDPPEKEKSEGQGAEAEGGAAEGEQGGGQPPEAPKPPDVKINFDRIWERVRLLSTQGGPSFVPRVSPDGQWVYYLSGAGGGIDLWAANVETGENMPLGVYQYMGDMQLTANGDKIYFLGFGGRIGFVGVNGPQVMGMGVIPFVADMKIDRSKELLQMYGECWRLLRGQFYDENLHGAKDRWNAVYQKYLPVVEQAKTPEEFYYIIFDLLGEMHGSHLGVYGDNSFKGVPEYSGILGLDFDPDYAGDGFKVSHVLRDGPADRDESRIKPGEIVLSVNGTSVGRSLDVEKVLDSTPGDQVDLSVKAEDGVERTVHLIPLDGMAWYQTSYLEWVYQRTKMADDLSGGRVGYVHIQGMDGESLAKFRADLFGLNVDKDALIIDVRFNGGGWTHDQVLAFIDKATYGFSRPRGGEFYAQPAMTWKKPMVVLINGSSYSDAEIFPMAFKSLGLGKLVGVPTNGSVIGTIEWSLVDGTGFRLPLEGWFYKDKRNMEVAGERGFGGVQPDIYVENGPNEVRAGQDLQLEAAVKELLAEIRS